MDKKYKTIDEVKKKVKSEPDVYLFEYMGLHCIVYRVLGHLNGYVALPEQHPLRGMNYYYWLDDEDTSKYKDEFLEKANRINNIEVHGGLTFGGKLSVIKVEGLDLSFCFGFDTAHSGDFTLSDHKDINEIASKGLGEYSDYRDLEYVVEETQKLAKQLSF